jgi:hypothetical protein
MKGRKSEMVSAVTELNFKDRFGQKWATDVQQVMLKALDTEDWENRMKCRLGNIIRYYNLQ